MLKVRVKAQPIEGEANAALEKLLVRALGLRGAEVRVARGAASRSKAVEVDGLTIEEIRERLGA